MPSNRRPRLHAILTLVILFSLASLPAWAQTFSVIYNFTLASGWGPFASVTLDAAGNLYGTTSGSGAYPGTVFELTPSNGAWTFNTLFRLISPGVARPYYPWSGVVFGPDGALYGTTNGGGLGYGTVYRVDLDNDCESSPYSPTGSIIYEFQGGSDGARPGLGNVVFDSAGNLYGTTIGGGSSDDGTVYELSPSNGGWTKKVLHRFSAGTDGQDPYGPVVFDTAGNLYGTTAAGGLWSAGTVYELTPSGSGWQESILFNFQNNNQNGYYPLGGLIFDSAGNLYGTTYYGETGGAGTVFELSPSSGGWNFNLLHTFSGQQGGPEFSLAMDRSGALYGTTYGGGNYGWGQVFQLTPHNGSWDFTSLHRFTGGADGQKPNGPTLDAAGNLYGTTIEGGLQQCEPYANCGVVWKITP